MVNKQELHDIFSRLRAGDASQFELLYKNYNLLVYKIAFSILKCKEASEDVTQTVFTKIYSLKKEKLPSAKEATWLYSVTKNEAISYYRKEKQNIPLEEIYGVSDETECRDIQDIIDKEKYEKIINGLSLKEKEIVSLKIIGELSFKEISKILNEPIGTVQWRYYKALNSLKLLLGNISMFIATLTLYISSIQYKKSKIIETNNEAENNSQITIDSEITEDIAQDKLDNMQTDEKIENIIGNSIEDNGNKTTETIEIQQKDEKIHNMTSNICLIFASIFLVLTIMFAIICTKHQQNRKNATSK